MCMASSHSSYKSTTSAVAFRDYGPSLESCFNFRILFLQNIYFSVTPRLYFRILTHDTETKKGLGEQKDSINLWKATIYVLSGGRQWHWMLQMETIGVGEGGKEGGRSILGVLPGESLTIGAEINQGKRRISTVGLSSRTIPHLADAIHAAGIKAV
ncbi:aspartate aminotransferase 3 [Perilla frutescens var. hirtella]|nr:aspartate aminotransferase 3 [Perilla frutescens var. hirtella]